MKRSLEKLSDGTFDVLVIGGGIHGAAIGFKAATSGFSVALIEQKDFAWATSANSLKIIHGGIRYFQQADPARVRESVRARREMMTHVGELIRPLPCILPTRGFGIKSREAMRLVLRIYDLFAFDRNQGLPEDRAIPRGRILAMKECLSLFPEASRKGMTGAALWYDALATDSERIPLAYIQNAAGKGAVVANYLKVVDLMRHRNRILGVAAVDGLTGRNLEVKAKMVINATGPWINTAIRSRKFETLGWVKGINLVVRKKLVDACAVGLEKAPGYRRHDNGMLFLVPWRGHTLIGTLYQPYHEHPEALKIKESDIRELLDLVNGSHPAAKLDLNDVSFFHCGLLPSRAVKAFRASAAPDSHSEIVDHEKEDGIKGILSIKSVKYTTAPRVAERVVRLLIGKVGTRTGVQPEPETGAAAAGPGAQLIGNDSLDPETVLHAVKEEMALRLSDLVFRRTNLGASGPPSRTVLESASQTMGGLLGWTPKRIEEEIQEVDACYAFRNA